MHACTQQKQVGHDIYMLPKMWIASVGNAHITSRSPMSSIMFIPLDCVKHVYLLIMNEWVYLQQLSMIVH